jgi:hypothetical protein
VQLKLLLRWCVWYNLEAVLVLLLGPELSTG